MKNQNNVLNNLIKNVGHHMLFVDDIDYLYVGTGWYTIHRVGSYRYIAAYGYGMQEAFILLKSFQCSINQFMELHWLVLITKCLSTFFFTA